MLRQCSFLNALLLLTAAVSGCQSLFAVRPFDAFPPADVAKELVDFTESWNVDLLVMHRPKRSFFERLFHRSVIKKEVFDSKVPLLIIK